MARVMRAAVLEEFGRPFVVEEVELDPPEPDGVIVRTGASAFCATDCMNQRGDLGKELPTVLGHSAVGVIEEVGSAVTAFTPGDRVVVPGTPECGRCFWCVRGRPDQCAELYLPQPRIGRRANGQPLTTSGAGGTYAEKMRVRQSWLFPVETGLPDEVLALMGCGITTGLGCIFNIARVEPGSSVAIVGCGHLGLWMIQGARVAGAERIIAVDPLRERRELAARLGATHLVDPAEGDPVEQVRALTEGRGADCALESAIEPEGQVQAFLMTRRAGVVVPTSISRLNAEVVLPQVELAIRGRDIRSCQNGRVRMGRDIPRFVRMLEAGVIDASPIISKRYPLEAINEVAAAAERREILTGVVVP